MPKANQNARYFFKQGVVDKEIAYHDEKLTVTLNIPTNYQNDTFMEEFTDMVGDGGIQAAALIQARLLRNIVELPFDIPRSLDIDGEYIKWSDGTEAEKICGISIMDPTLREKINSAILGEANLSVDDMEN